MESQELKFWSRVEWWYVGIATVLISPLAMVLAMAVFSVFSGANTLGHAVSMVPFIWLFGIFFFFLPAWLIGIVTGFVAWPVIWSYAARFGLSESGTAALCAFGIAIGGGVIPWGLALSLRDGDGVLFFVFWSACVAVLIGPTFAWWFYRTGRDESENP